MAADAYEIGWWILSAEEELYGPVSRETLRRYFKEGVISPNTLVRHCTQAEPRPVADQLGIREEVVLAETSKTLGDHLAEAWPRKTKQRLQLAEGTLPCIRHRRSAVLFCLRCQAPYCPKCQSKPRGRPFYFCRRCQANNYNRRFLAFWLDNFLFYTCVYALGIGVLLVIGMSEDTFQAFFSLVVLAATVLFLFRDTLFAGAGPGKRLFGLRVVTQRDGTSPLGYGQAVLRWVSLAIPIFNLFDLSVPFRDPLLRRYGDRWAGTRVIDTPRALEKARAKTRAGLAKKGVQLPPPETMTMEQFAQIAE
jgi:uncharacterized RDD family membrane protein YckC